MDYQNQEQNGNWNLNGYQNHNYNQDQPQPYYSYQAPDYEEQVIKRTRKCFSRTGIVFAVFLAVSYLSQAGVVTVLALTEVADWLGYEMCMLLTIFAMYPVAVPLTGVLMKWVPKTGAVGRERWSLGKLCGFFVASMGVLYVGNLIGTILMTVAGILKGEPIVNDMPELIGSMEVWTVLLSAVIVAPIMEELVFRKFLLDRIAGFGHWTAMMVSGVLFGVVHGNFYQFFYAFGLGMIFAYIYLHTGRITYTIGFHMLINFCGSILPLGLLHVIEKNVIFGSFLSIGNMMVMLGYVICGVVLAAICWKDLYFAPANDGLTGRKRAGAVWCNLGMVLFYIFGLLMFASSF